VALRNGNLLTIYFLLITKNTIINNNQ